MLKIPKFENEADEVKWLDEHQYEIIDMFLKNMREREDTLPQPQNISLER